jgi:hypothetical protein
VIRFVVVAVLLVALVAAAVVYERRARSTAAHRLPVALHLERRRVDPPVVEQALDEVTREALATAAGRVGRHRRDMPVVPVPVTMTGFMRRLDADAVAADARMRHAVALETGELPRVRG